MKANEYCLRAHRGFSLVELLVAMVIALVVMAGVINSFLASKDAYRYNQELAFIQENARFANSKMGSDIRDAGNFGCRTSDGTNNYYDNNLVNVLGDTSSLSYPDLFTAVGVQGYNNTTGWPTSDVQAAVTAVNATTPPDAIMVRHADLDDNDAYLVQGHSGHAFTLSSANTKYPDGAIMVFADAQCRYQAIFRATGPAPGSTTLTMDHTANTGSAPKNYAEVLLGKLKQTGYFFGDYTHSSSECPSTTNCSWQDSSATYLTGSKLMPLTSNIYYVGRSTIDPSINSLWVVGLNSSGTGAGQIGSPQELVLGVDDMRIYYGVDTLNPDGTNAPDGNANRYVTANQIAAQIATSTATNGYLVWNRVTSVRVQLLMRSRGTISSRPSQTFRWEGDTTDLTKNDGYLRQMVSFTIQLRNPFRG